MGQGYTHWLGVAHVETGFCHSSTQLGAPPEGCILPAAWTSARGERSLAVLSVFTQSNTNPPAQRQSEPWVSLSPAVPTVIAHSHNPTVPTDHTNNSGSGPTGDTITSRITLRPFLRLLSEPKQVGYDKEDLTDWPLPISSFSWGYLCCSFSCLCKGIGKQTEREECCCPQQYEDHTIYFTHC